VRSEDCKAGVSIEMKKEVAPADVLRFDDEEVGLKGFFIAWKKAGKSKRFIERKW